MYTVAETRTFSRYAADYWTESERGAFAAWIAANPDAGDVIPGSNGCRKVRWSRAGMGKRGGVRIIYYHAVAERTIWLLVIYGKGARDTVPAHVLRSVREEIENG